MSRSYLFHGLRLAPLSLAAMLHCTGAIAALSDTIHPYVSVGYTYDDNLLRLPDGYSGLEGGSDRMTQSQVGILIERPFGRQKLTGTAKVSRVTFDRFDQLNYNGKDFNGDLAWQLGNRFSGTLGGVYNETLTPFTDMVTNQRNLRKTRRGYVTAAWRFHPSWQLRTGFTRSKYDYELVAQRVNNRSDDLFEFGGDYLASSGSRVGLVARQLKGSYEKLRNVGGFVYANDYTQRELKANINWIISGVTQVQVLAGYAKREYDSFSTRDSSGFNGRATVRWAPLGKVRFTAEAWREFAAVESLVVSNSLNRGASLAATWEATGKIQANASLRRESRDFEAISNIVAGLDAPDRTRSAQLGLVYSPTLATQISVNVFNEKRTGSPLVGTNDYNAKGVSVNASAQF
jgi:exopolysaccharide biosynthesis operon protein EpsL